MAVRPGAGGGFRDRTVGLTAWLRGMRAGPVSCRMARKETAMARDDQIYPNRDSLPLEDYDHLPLGDLTSRVRTLDADGVAALIGYEREHGNRTPMLTLLEARLAALQEGAEPSGGSPIVQGQPDQEPPQKEPAVSPATSGSKLNSPPHGKPPYTTSR